MKIIKKYCKYCGTLMEVEPFSVGFNKETGEQIFNYNLRCKYKRFLNRHEKYSTNEHGWKFSGGGSGG